MIDLHLHSKFSDGLDTPTELIEKSLKIENLKAIALTDHDTVEGLDEFLLYGETKDIIVIPGIEISLRHEPKREIKGVHIIGLNIDHESNLIKKTLQQQINSRINQKKAICERLRDEFGYQIKFREVENIASGKAIGRPHIVEILIKNNPEVLNDFSKVQLFNMIGYGGPAYVERKFELSLEESIELIKFGGGISILAHPGIYQVSDRKKFVKMCVNAGIEGIEIEYTYSKNQPFLNTNKEEWAQLNCPKYYNKIADNLELIKSGGSDYHGGKKGINIGDAKVPDSYLKKIL